MLHVVEIWKGMGNHQLQSSGFLFEKTSFLENRVTHLPYFELPLIMEVLTRRSTSVL